MPPTRIKVCCIGSVVEAKTAVDHGAAALGLVSAMPSGPGVISEALIGEIADSVPPTVATVLLTSLQDVDEIVSQHRRCRTNTIQLVDDLAAGTPRDLRTEIPGISILQVIHVDGPGAVDRALAIAPEVHGILLDSGNQVAPVKILGGTGQTHDWALSRRIVEEAPVPTFLAGGLSPDNVAEAIEKVQPFGVDLCSGVRTAGKLDDRKLAAFVRAVREADEAER